MVSGKLIPTLLLLTTIIGVTECGKKHHHKGPVKPLFGVGLGYKRVVSYKPVLILQKHKHIKVHHKHHGHHHHGWGWGHSRRGSGGWGWRQQRGHSSGGGWKHFKHVDHHHYHHRGWGWDGAGEEEDYGGWESNVRANWSSPHDGKIPDQQVSGYYSDTHSQRKGVASAEIITEDPFKHVKGLRNYAIFNMGVAKKGGRSRSRGDHDGGEGYLVPPPILIPKPTVFTATTVDRKKRKKKKVKVVKQRQS